MLVLLLLAQSMPMTGAPPVDCSRARVALPSALTGWGRDSTSPNIGRAFTLAATAPSVPTKRPGGMAIANLRVIAKGTYSVAIDQGAWIDVSASGRPLGSTAHRHGPACSGIRKIVDFVLTPGAYTLTLSGITGPTVKVLVAPTS